MWSDNKNAFFDLSNRQMTGVLHSHYFETSFVSHADFVAHQSIQNAMKGDNVPLARGHRKFRLLCD
eukprot:3165035-Amphidinium_carterae.1